MKVVALSNTGLVRLKNEDNYLVDEALGLLLICDGMGGHNGGDVASRIAVETIEKEYRNSSITQTGQKLVEALKKANIAIFNQAQKEPSLHGMGTTATAAVISEKTMEIAHIGDSRLYIIRSGSMRKATRDHTLAEQFLADGLLKPEEMRSNPYNHILTRALGVEEDVSIDHYQESLEADDIIMLCSDGLSDLVSEEEMLVVLGDGSLNLNQAAQGLIEKALNYGGSDNITIILSRI